MQSQPERTERESIFCKHATTIEGAGLGARGDIRDHPVEDRLHAPDGPPRSAPARWIGPTALLVGNNLMTLGALEAIHECGLEIPDDIAIIRYDDAPWALAFDPPHTPISQPGYEMGRKAVELPLRRIEDPDAAAQLVVLQPRLIARGSRGTRRRA